MNAQPSSSTEVVRRIRELHSRSSRDFMIETRNRETVITAIEHTDDTPSIVCTMSAVANPADIEFLATAHVHIGELLEMIERAARMIRTGRPQQEPHWQGKDYTTHASIMCNQTNFRTYLAKHHGLSIGEDFTDADANKATAKSLKTALNIKSRKELNSDPSAKSRWLGLYRDFQKWTSE